MQVAYLKAKQTGATLILMAFIIALAATVYLLKAYDPAQLRLEQDEKTYLALNEAKQALIAWSVSHPTNPGQMPLPDRNGEATPNYDGFSDCPPSSTPFTVPNSYALFIGQLPIYGQGAPCVAPLIGLGGDFYDGQGNRLWYAVSRNLVHRYEFLSANPNSNPTINPGIIDSSVWLKVLDENGNKISDRVAAVIISPGTTIGAQNRSGAANVTNYLDTFKIGSITFSNNNYATAGEDFVITRKNADVNDKLVYITIDELMVALSKRAVAEASNFLKQHREKTGQWPDAANLVASKASTGNLLHNHKSQLSKQKGMLPIDERDYCSCESFQKCKCSFFAIKNVTMTTVAPNPDWTTSSGACVRSGNKCICTDAGSCTAGSVDFVCDTFGLCTTTQAGLNSFTYAVDDEPTYEGACNRNNPTPPWNGKVTCKDVGGFSVGWFKNNFWQDYFYYEWSLVPPYLQVGNKTDVRALLIGAGQAIGTQNRPPSNPSPNLIDYLDSVENTNGDNKFDATTQQKTNNYNDQTFIVEP